MPIRGLRTVYAGGGHPRVFRGDAGNEPVSVSHSVIGEVWKTCFSPDSERKKFRLETYKGSVCVLSFRLRAGPADSPRRHELLVRRVNRRVRC